MSSSNVLLDLFYRLGDSLDVDLLDAIRTPCYEKIAAGDLTLGFLVDRLTETLAARAA